MLEGRGRRCGGSSCVRSGRGRTARPTSPESRYTTSWRGHHANSGRGSGSAQPVALGNVGQPDPAADLAPPEVRPLAGGRTGPPRARTVRRSPAPGSGYSPCRGWQRGRQRPRRTENTTSRRATTSPLVAGRHAAVCLVARSSAALRGVAGEHVAGLPPGEAHEVAFVPVGRHPRVSECVPKRVRVNALDPGVREHGGSPCGRPRSGSLRRGHRARTRQRRRRDGGHGGGRSGRSPARWRRRGARCGRVDPYR